MTTPLPPRLWSVGLSGFALLSVSFLVPGWLLQVSAQTLQSRPVARLISKTSDENRYTRPRRVARPVDKTNSDRTSAASVSSLNSATEIERHAFAATNQLRANNGCSALVWDRELTRMARVHSQDMARLGFFAHETPNGLRLRDRARALGIRFDVIGENIAYNQGVEDPGTFAVQRWMISPGHRANILSREFQTVGVGSFVSSDGRVFITQIFIAR